ncbi:hypothetical protein PH552_01660 [Rhizobium sp. CNPSo 3968]|uniref:hypothetical protein n=1 Tax=Rhizobium sp. CNPSo 3968 TaxID=3021408 RepID=UPI00254BF505|nr:hypothetical protein [Rhizobium sp. CNPSo 3968]MDK4718055.1 hypothetical protein [Rhizobium sp. CNPSo 3968]
MTSVYYSSTTRYSIADRSNPASGDVYDKLSDDEGGGKGSDTSDMRPTIDSRPSASASIFQGKIAMTALDLKPINVAELSEDKYQEFMEANQRHIGANKKYLESQYTKTSNPNYSNDPRVKPYATITVADQVVATIDNQGVVSTESNELGERINKLLTGLNEDATSSGPAAAQNRADKIAEMLGGRIVKAGTAMTQSEYGILAAFEQPTSTIDYPTMKTDPLYDQLQNLYAKHANIERERADYLGRQ